jgi:hypothetical protein
LNSRLLRILGYIILACLLIGIFAYSRYIDWPSGDASPEVRVYLPDQYPLSEAYHYTLRDFMDTWELYRFSTSSDAVAFLVNDLNLESQGMVNEFDLIISKPPPHWWDPEHLLEAEYYQSRDRAADGRLYDLLCSKDDGIVYMIRFDG